jgi:hypothetical protein
MIWVPAFAGMSGQVMTAAIQSEINTL